MGTMHNMSDKDLFEREKRYNYDLRKTKRQMRMVFAQYMLGELFDSGTGENQRPLTKEENKILEMQLCDYFDIDYINKEEGK